MLNVNDLECVVAQAADDFSGVRAIDYHTDVFRLHFENGCIVGADWLAGQNAIRYRAYYPDVFVSAHEMASV